jgi:hypothetical protein
MLELGVDQYNIERGKDGIVFNKIGMIQVEEDVFTDRENIYKDFSSLPIRFHRIKIEDINGSVNYSDIRYVERNNTNKIRPYPNPVNTELIIDGGRR